MPGLGLTANIILYAEWAVRLILGIRIIMRRSSSTETMAWLIVVLFIPFLGLIAYLLVGEVSLGVRRARRYEQLGEGVGDQAVSIWHHQHLDWEPQEEEYRHIARTAGAISGMPPLRGNVLELIAETDEMLDRLISDIDQATHHVHLLYYIWMSDGRGIEVAESVTRAARRGVACRVLVDTVGSKKFLRSPTAREMRQAGVQVVEALPVMALRSFMSRIDLRNHRKIAVIDGRIGYAGSQNINDNTFNVNAIRKIGPWIDATVRIIGPACLALQAVFLRDWQFDSSEKITDMDQFFPIVSREARGGSVLHVVPSGPAQHGNSIHQAMLASLYAARDEIIITTPYFVPDPVMLAALRIASQRGVDVRIVLPRHLDAPLVAAAAASFYVDLLESGVIIFQYDSGLLHAKTMTVDRKFALIGSANFDMRSFWLNFEISLLIYDDDFSGLIRFMQTSYMNESVQVDLASWRRRPYYQRFFDNTVQLLSPIL